MLGRYPHLRRLIIVADRGLLSLDKIEQLSALTVSCGQPIEFVLAVPGRRYEDFETLLESVQTRAANAAGKFIEELRWHDRRLVLAHDPAKAQERGALRRARLAALERRAEEFVGKLDGQDDGSRWRGRRL